MFSLTISFGPASLAWTLMFNDEESARAAHLAVTVPEGEYFSIRDDFGQTADLKRASVHGVMLEDMEKSKLAHIERALHQARLQAKAQEMAENDSQLRAARARSGPAIIDPMGRQVSPNGMSPFR